MIEKIINIDDINQIEFFGINEKNLDFINMLFPNIMIVVRGQKMKIKGENEEVERFNKFFDKVKVVYKDNNILNEKLIMKAFNEDVVDKRDSEVLVYGNNGLAIKARTKNQQRMVKEIERKDMLFAIGPAGSGKTYTAVALAVKYLKEKRVKKIILTRPAVEAGENLGFLPGDLKDKLDPYLQPLYDALRDMLSQSKLDYYLENHIIEIAPLAFMRGRTLENSFAILDEAQNATKSQLKMFITRMGNCSKFIIAGDKTQIDLPNKTQSGLVYSVNLLKDIKDIAIVWLNGEDIVRNPLVTKIVEKYEQEKMDY
ncbi:MAG: PhoH family protein [Bacteroidales bacterium]|jgi:phosphate starvation-inducible PhoH-like protein|nr:PhoH family protein [Bacteroidales bacterium]